MGNETIIYCTWLERSTDGSDGIMVKELPPISMC